MDRYLNFTLKIIFILLIPFMYLSYNYISQETYKMRFYTVAEGDPSYLKSINEQNFPIINEITIKDFSKTTILKLLNYKTVSAVDKLEKNKKLFTKSGYEGFYSVFDYVVNEESSNGVVIKETVVVDGPFILGRYNFLNDVPYYVVYLKTLQTTYGLSGSMEDKNLDYIIIVKIEKFSENQKGLSIDSININ